MRPGTRDGGGGRLGFLRVAEGDRVIAGACEAVITHLVSADQVMVRDLTTGAAGGVALGRDVNSPSVTRPQPHLGVWRSPPAARAWAHPDATGPVPSCAAWPAENQTW